MGQQVSPYIRFYFVREFVKIEKFVREFVNSNKFVICGSRMDNKIVKPTIPPSIVN